MTAWEERNPNEYFCFGAKQYLALGMQTRFIAAGLGLSALALVLVVATTRWARFLCGLLRDSFLSCSLVAIVSGWRWA